MGVEALREQLSAEVLELFDMVRARILEVAPDSVEVTWPKQKITSFGVGPKKMSEHCIAKQRNIERKTGSPFWLDAFFPLL